MLYVFFLLIINDMFETMIEVRISQIEIKNCIWLKHKLKINYDIENIKKIQNVFIKKKKCNMGIFFIPLIIMDIQI